MKQLTKLFFFASLIFIISSCSEKSVINELNEQESVATPQPVIVITEDNGETTVTEIPLHELTTPATALVRKSYKNNSHHSAQGIVTTTSPNTLIFHAVENKSGIHGKNRIDGSYFVNVKFNSECLTVVNNQAYFGGTITSWEAGPEFPPGTGVGEGWSLYSAVEDNGEGGNTIDAFGAQLMFFPPGTTIQNLELANGLPTGYFATQNIYSICDFVASLYATATIPYIFIPGINPTNVQVK